VTNIAVVGIGRWGKNLVSTFEQLSSVSYVCHTGNRSNADWIRAEYPHITLTQSYEDILNNPEVDAVVIATPIETHEELAEQALQVGKHVFVEKPLAKSSEAAWELVTLAERKSVVLFTGYVFLYAPAMERLRKQIDNDPVKHICASWKKFGTFNSNIQDTLLCHDVAISQYLFDSKIISGKNIQSIGIRTNSDIATFVFETKVGNTLVSYYDRVSRTNEKSVVVTTESGKRYEFSDDSLYRLDGNTHTDLTPVEAPDPLLVECRQFLECIDGTATPPTIGSFGAEVTTLLEQI